MPGVIEGLKILQDAGFKLIIITNQSGIAMGYYTESDFFQLNNWMLDNLKTNGVHISKVYYCPHLPDARIDKYREVCECRKPKIGMYMKAISKFDIDINNSYAIGDKIRDCAICKDTACKGFLIGHNEKEEIITDVKSGFYERVQYSESLYNCALKILEEKNK